jgi:outer membrane protein TolC
VADLNALAAELRAEAVSARKRARDTERRKVMLREEGYAAGLDAAADRLDALSALAAARGQEDAARYRWLRDPKNVAHEAWESVMRLDVTDEQMDAAIDAAMKDDDHAR